MQHPEVRWKATDISEEHVSNFKVEQKDVKVYQEEFFKEPSPVLKQMADYSLEIHIFPRKNSIAFFCSYSWEQIIFPIYNSTSYCFENNHRNICST
jgi:hypothetical protein